MNQPTVLPHRPDIDGLRGVAVLSVILFHVDPGLVPGGFAGVDIFFVVSGFLITGIIVEGLQAGTFTLRDFYGRRVKRLGPVLALVVFVTLLAGILVLLPEDLISLARSALASMAFVANLFFEKTIATGYFAPSTNTIPLLHLWSLGVEEQFYLVWPTALVLSARFLSGRQLFVMALLVSASFVVLSETFVLSDPKWAYYRLPSRAFELTAGAATFFAARDWTIGRSRRAREACATAGALAILFSLVFVTERLPFPGIDALPVAVGTALVLFAGARGASVVGSVLATRLLVGTGLISYSLYLWHWPVLAFLRYLFASLSTGAAVGALAATVLLSLASYRLVEQPARRVHWSFARIAAAFAVVPAGVVGVLAAWLMVSDGFGPYGATYRAALASAKEASAPAYLDSGVCLKRAARADDLSNPDCIVNGRVAPQGGVRTLLWGDSHASHYVGLVGAFAETLRFAFRNVGYASCPPLIAPPRSYGEYPEDCVRAQAAVAGALDRFDTVMLAGAWHSYAPADGFADAVRSTVAELRRRGHPVILLGQVPLIPGFDRRCEEKAVKVPFLRCRARVSRMVKQPLPFNEVLKDIAGSMEGVTYFDPDRTICPDGRCSAYVGGRPVYFDRQHLSMAGSRIVGRRIITKEGVPASVFAPAVGDKGP